jgi:hypothetical protein
MNAHHYKAAYWVGKRVFDGLASFTEFESRVNDCLTSDTQRLYGLWSLWNSNGCEDQN